MNEQIRKIESQAWGQVKRTNGLVRTEDFNEKFAELIIKKCAIIANRADNTETEIRCMYDVITEHFGIEE